MSLPSAISLTQKSIAVLPFVNMSSSGENEFFSDGITEEIINALTRIPELRVTSRTSSFFFKNKNLPIQEIGEQLGVALLLEGSVRVAGNVMRITAQLIHAKEDFHFWSDTWDRKVENIFEIQDEVSLLIAEKAREFLGHFEIQDHLVPRQTESLDSYSWYLKGRFHFRKWNPEDARKAIECYDHALALDPRHAESMIGKADALSFLATTNAMDPQQGWEQAARLIQQGLQINDKLPDGYYQLSHQHFFVSGDFTASLQSAQKSFELNQNYPEANQQLAFLYQCAGRLDLAQPYVERSLSLDPLSQETQFFHAYYEYQSGQYKKALQILNRSLEENQLNVPAHSVRCYCLLKLGKYEEALHYFDSLPPEIVVEEDELGIRTLAYLLMQQENEALELVRELEHRAQKPEGFRANSFLIFVYALQGEKQKAWDWVKREKEKKSAFLLLHFTDPLMENLKAEPWYQETLDEVFSFSPPSPAPSDKKALLSAEEAASYLEKLQNLMQSQQPYLDPGLSLKSLAELLSMHPNQLSWLINEKTGKNFNQFINSYRVAAFQEKVRDPQNAHLSILGMAFESGFNSKTVFNTYFKKETGLTPKAWMKKKG
jgi:adenylate cyclase